MSPYMKAVLSFLGGLILLLVSIWFNITQAAPVVANPHAMTDAEYAFACGGLKALKFDKVDCTKLPKPIVVVTLLVEAAKGDWEALYGVTFRGEPYIFINATSEAGNQRAIVVHESIHYILDSTYGDTVNSCVSEAAARMVTAAWQRVEYTDDWMEGYGCVYNKGGPE